MSLKVDIDPYSDSFGYVQPDTTGRSCHNSIRFTGTYYLLLHKYGLIEEYDKEKFRQLIKLCEVLPGLYKRHPTEWKQDQISMDDYIVLAHCASNISREIVYRIFDYGCENDWTFNNVNPGKFTLSAWFGRQQQFVAHIFFCAGKHPPLLSKLYWCAAIIYSAFRPKKDQDSWLLSYSLIDAARGRSSICDLAARLWGLKLKRSEPSKLGVILGDYFQNHNHPLAKYFVEWDDYDKLGNGGDTNADI